MRAFQVAVLSLQPGRWRLSCSLLLGLALGTAGACNPPLERVEPQPAPGEPRFPVRVRTPEKLTSIETGADSPIAQELRVSCSTCHSLREPAPLPPNAAALEEFHGGLELRHGILECSSCHVPGQEGSLHLSSGAVIPMTDVMTLCGQCHGPQRRDYERGAHGGMRGYWDLSRGPRDRNSCVDCHDPHAPAYVGGMPAPPPRDRFLPRKGPAR